MDPKTLMYLRAATQQYTCLCGSRLGSGNVFGLFLEGPEILRFFAFPFAWKSQFQLLEDNA